MLLQPIVAARPESTDDDGGDGGAVQPGGGRRATAIAVVIYGFTSVMAKEAESLQVSRVAEMDTPEAHKLAHKAGKIVAQHTEKKLFKIYFQ